jgi:hypothetical protein
MIISAWQGIASSSQLRIKSAFLIFFSCIRIFLFLAAASPAGKSACSVRYYNRTGPEMQIKVEEMPPLFQFGGGGFSLTEGVFLCIMMVIGTNIYNVL